MTARGARAGAPERIVLGRVATLGGPTGFGWSQAIAISDGRVVATGTPAAMLALAGPRTIVWRLGAGHVAIPGIVDAHLHLVSAALAAQQTDLTSYGDRQAVLVAVGAADARLHAAGDHDGWLLGHGWSLDQLGTRPAAMDLDRVAPGRAVALWSHDHHSRWVSGVALAAAGITHETTDPGGGRIGRGPDGAPDGMLFEDAATLVDRAIPPPDGWRLAAALTRYAAGLARLGVVGAHDPGEVTADPVMLRGPTLYRDLAAHGRLPLRVVASIREDQLDVAVAAGVRTGRTVDPASGTPGHLAARYRDGWLKLFADGALGSRSAALLAPYEALDPGGPPLGGPNGMLLRDAEALMAAARRATDAGIAVQIHGIGDAAVRVALDVLAGLPRPGAAQHRVEHAQLVDPVDQGRFAALGIAASVQPCHLISDAVAARAAWGDRTAHAFPLAALAATGATLAFGTDAPVEPPDPWPGIAAAVIRGSGRWPAEQADLHPEQAIPGWRALRAACRDVARSAGIADEGHLEPGARADLVVLPSAAFDDPPARGGALELARPLATLIDGDIAWQDPGFDP